MTEEFFGLTNTPFSREIPADKLYESAMMMETIDRLTYAANKQLFAVLTSDVGCGKTTAVRRLCSVLDSSKYMFLYVSDSQVTPRWFYKCLLEQMGVEASFYRGEAKNQLHRELEVIRGVHKRKVVTIVDEAHLLGKDTLEEIRFLLNFKMDSQSPLTLILSGQTELWDKLKLQPYAAIRQRIDIQCIVGRLDRARTTEYISAQLAYAGTDREIFTEAAIDEIFKFSGGIPRLINKACSETLMYGTQNRKTILDDRMVKLVVDQELIGGNS